MGNAIAFYVTSALILGFALLVVTTKNTVHAVLFLVLNFLAVAALYVLLTAQFLAVIQVLVYAGGIVVLYLFVVMLVSLRGAPEPLNTGRQSGLGFILAAVMLAEVSAILMYSAARPASAVAAAPARPEGGNTEVVGMMLYTDYLVPFELASMLLLVAMVGAILLARKEA